MKQRIPFLALKPTKNHRRIVAITGKSRGASRTVNSQVLLGSVLAGFSWLAVATGSYGQAVPLGAATNFPVVSAAGVTSAGFTVINGDVALTPMSHPHQPMLAGTHPRLPVVLSLCLLMAGITLAGVANPGDHRLPVAVDSPDIERHTGDLNGADCSIFAWKIKPTAQPSCGTGHCSDNAGGGQTDAAGGDATPAHDETILRIVNGSSNSTQTFWDTNNAWTGILTDPTASDKMDWARINGGGFKDGRFGNTIPGLAAVTSDRVPAGVKSFHPAPVQGSVIALVGVLLITSLVGLLGYCAVVSSKPATCCKSVTQNTPCRGDAHGHNLLTMSFSSDCQKPVPTTWIRLGPLGRASKCKSKRLSKQ